jgi:hypothetical protein
MKLTKKSAIIALGATLITSATLAAWSPSHHQERNYFHDAAKTQSAGHTIQWCSGRFSKYGTITAYYNIEENFPCKRDELN